MSVRVSKIAVAAIALGATAPAIGVNPGVGVDHASATIGITGFVPVVCTARVAESTLPVAAGTAQLGKLREFCNSPGGYRVVADYSPSLVHAKLLVDGKPIPLAKDGSVTVSRSNGPAIDSRLLALELPKNATGGSISFRMEPL